MFLDLTAYKWHKSSHLRPSDQTLSCNLSVCTSCTSLFPPRPSPPLSSAKPAGAVMLEELCSSNNRVIRGIDCGGRRVKKKKKIHPNNHAGALCFQQTKLFRSTWQRFGIAGRKRTETAQHKSSTSRKKPAWIESMWVKFTRSWNCTLSFCRLLLNKTGEKKHKAAAFVCTKHTKNVDAFCFGGETH